MSVDLSSRLAGVLEGATGRLGEALVASHTTPEDLWLRVDRAAWVDTFRMLRDDLGARWFSWLSAIDWMPSPFGRSMDAEVDNRLSGASPREAEPIVTGYAGGDTRFQVVARVGNIAEHWGVTVKADLPDGDLSVASLIPVYSGANWHEREAWEMFGIGFVGHPDLRHIYLPSDFEGNPLRKDFPLVARMVKPWPGIVDVEPMPGDDEGDAEGGES
jgi:NADH-quinone oxidoreductase subunit C